MGRESKPAAPVPFQGTAVLLSSRTSPAAAELSEAAGDVFRRQSALRLERVEVRSGSVSGSRLAELATRVGEANPCLVLLADDASRHAAEGMRPYFPSGRPATFGLLEASRPRHGPPSLLLEDGTDLERWLDAGSWRDSPAFRRYGVRDGIAVDGVDAVLSTVRRLVPAPVECLLAYAQSEPRCRRFGDLALRIGDDVYACNSRAVSGVESWLLQPTSLADYLYGTRSPLVHGELTEAFGSCYGRSVLGLSLFHVGASSTRMMKAAIEELNDCWRRGELRLRGATGPSGPLLARVMAAGGLIGASRVPRGPADLFTRLLADADRRGALPIVVHYRRIAGSESCYREDAFPWRLTRPWPGESARRRLEARCELRVDADSATRRLELDTRAYRWPARLAATRRSFLTGTMVTPSGRVAKLACSGISQDEPAFGALFENTTRKLVTLLDASPDRYQALLVAGPDLAVREAAVEAMARIGRLVVLTNGERGEELAELAARHRPDAMQVVERKKGLPFDTAPIIAALRHTRGQPVFVLVVHHEPARGVLNDLRPISHLCREFAALLFVESSGGLGAHSVDAAELGVTLCTGSPCPVLGGLPGLGFVIGDRNFFRRLQRSRVRPRPLDLTSHYRLAVEGARMPPGAPVHAILALAEAIGSFVERGPENVRIDLARRAAQLRRELLAAGLRFPVELDRMSAVQTPVLLPDGIPAAEVRQALLALGWLVGPCVAPLDQSGLMIGHGGDISMLELGRLVSALDGTIASLRPPELARAPELSAAATS